MTEQVTEVAQTPKRGRPPKAAGSTQPSPPEETKQVPISDIVQTFKAQGIPVSAAMFHQAVRNETRLTNDTQVLSRRAAMFLTPLGLIFEQKGKRVGVVPHANVIYVEL